MQTYASSDSQIEAWIVRRRAESRLRARLKAAAIVACSSLWFLRIVLGFMLGACLALAAFAIMRDGSAADGRLSNTASGAGMAVVRTTPPVAASSLRGAPKPTREFVAPL